MTTRGRFDVWWWNVSLTDGNDDHNWATDGEVPGITTGRSPGELVVFVHGFKNDGESDGDETFGEAAEAVRVEGYDQPVVGYSWDADRTIFQWW